MAVWGWPLVQVVLKSSSEDWGSKASPALGMEGGPAGLSSGCPAVNPGSSCGSHRLPQDPGPWGLRPGSLGALLHGQEGIYEAQVPRHQPDLLMWAEPRCLHVDDLLLGESGTHFLWVTPVRPCQDSYPAPEHSGSLLRTMPSPWLAADGVGEWGQLCPLPGHNQLKQQACFFLPLNRKCVPCGPGQRTKDTSGASAGSPAIQSLHPGLCGRTHTHTSTYNRGRGPGNGQYILILSFVFWNLLALPPELDPATVPLGLSRLDWGCTWRLAPLQELCLLERPRSEPPSAMFAVRLPRHHPACLPWHGTKAGATSLFQC